MIKETFFPRAVQRETAIFDILQIRCDDNDKIRTHSSGNNLTTALKPFPQRLLVSSFTSYKWSQPPISLIVVIWKLDKISKFSSLLLSFCVCYTCDILLKTWKRFHSGYALVASLHYLLSHIWKCDCFVQSWKISSHYAKTNMNQVKTYLNSK